MVDLAQLERAIAAIHMTPHVVVMEFAGAGAQALAWLHGVGGSSRTILEATDRYSAISLASAIGFRPVQFASRRVAEAMATAAYRRARTLARPGVPILGIGCTATIATLHSKRGEHRCIVSVRDAFGMTSYALTLEKGRARQEEEALVSLLIVQALADSCGVFGLPALSLVEGEAVEIHVEPAYLLTRLLSARVNWVAVAPDGQLTVGRVMPNVALLSGAFNPLHEGHKHLAAVATEILAQEVTFELPLVNADKAPIDLLTARRRAAQFAGFATVLFTCTPLFSEKASFFPESTFIIGVDTAARLVELRFYHHDPAAMHQALEALKGCRFLVAGRITERGFRTLRDLELPQAYRDLFEEIPAERFRMDISSTAIREGKVSS